MKYAIVKLNGKQTKVTEGQQIVTDRLDLEEGKSLALPTLLLVDDSGKPTIGTPEIKTHVSAKVIEHLKGKKVRVAKYKSKSKYRKVQGHRQFQTRLEILASGTSKEATVSK